MRASSIGYHFTIWAAMGPHVYQLCSMGTNNATDLFNDTNVFLFQLLGPKDTDIISCIGL